MDYIKFARESVAMYEVVADEELIDIQHLLAVVSGNKRATPELTAKLSSRGLRGLLCMSIQELEVTGLTHNDALKVHSSVILAKKLMKAANDMKDVTFKCLSDISDYLMPKMRYLDQENLVALYLNTKNQLIGEKTVFVGSLDSSIVHPREIFSYGLQRIGGVSSIIVAHNHPSGNSKPSKEDVDITKRLNDCGRILCINLLDHIVIGDGNFTSLKEKGYF